jgi:hypothetical protein
LAAFANQSAVAAETVKHWNDVANWEIGVDQSVGNGCFMVAQYARGTALRVGVDKAHGGGYLMVENHAWKSLETGKQYKLSFHFDDESSWEGTFTGSGTGDEIVLVDYFSEPKFLKDLPVKQTLAIYYQNKQITTLQLTGTYDALKAMIECQNQVDGLTAPSDRSDDGEAGQSTVPSNDTRSSYDPFR